MNWIQEGPAFPISLCDLDWILCLPGFDSRGQSLYVRKVSKVRLICIVGWCGLRLLRKRGLLMSACSSSFTSCIWRFLPRWFSNRLMRDPKTALKKFRQRVLLLSVGMCFSCRYLERHGLGFEFFLGTQGMDSLQTKNWRNPVLWLELYLHSVSPTTPPTHPAKSSVGVLTLRISEGDLICKRDCCRWSG